MRRFKEFILVDKRDILLILLALTAILIFVPIFTYFYFAKDFTSRERLMNRNDTGVILYDKNGTPFFTFYQAKTKNYIPLSEIPIYAQQAVISVEDKDFYYHPGFSVKSIIRSLIADLKEGELVYGGSTITQQLVKNSLLSSQKTFLRKYQELVLAQEIERRFSKAEILEMYLNSVYFGSGAFGIEQAAEVYFGKSAKDLTLAESAVLAGILPAPSKYSPFIEGSNKWKEKQQWVLQKMLEQDYINQEQYDDIQKKELIFKSGSGYLNSQAFHFALMVKDQLIEKYGEEEISRSGFRVYTSIDLDWQKQAEEVVKDQIQKLASQNATNGAVVVMDPKTGEIRVLVGSVDWYNDQFGKMNMALEPRSPGSSFKPIIYVTAFEKGLITPATVLKDEKITFKKPFSDDYSPQNYDRKFRGPVLVRRALANSLNVPAVEVMDKVGVEEGLNTAKKLGITTLKDPSSYGLSLVLGTGEVPLLQMTSVYATFANEGLRTTPTTIVKIEDKFGNVVYKHQPETTSVFNSKYTFLISSILSDNKARNEVFGNALTISRPSAVKTGTAEDYKDSLTLGYTPSLVIGVWVGNNDAKPMKQVAGSLGAAPIWKTLMEKFLKDTPVENFNPPADVLKLSICAYNGLLVKEATSSAIQEYFAAGTEPKKICFVPKPSSEPTPSPNEVKIEPSEAPKLEIGTKKEDNSTHQNKEKEKKD